MPGSLNGPPSDSQGKNSTVRDLPLETLSQIFQEAVFSPLVGDENGLWLGPHSHLVFGAVCSAWRLAAWHTPQLWTNIDVRVNQSNITFVISLLQLYFNNSGALPLTLSIEFAYNPVLPFNETELSLIHPSVDPLINQNLHRIEDPRLQSPSSPGCWSYPTRLLTKSNDAGPPTLSGETSLSWQSLTTLRLNSLPLDDCVKFLLQCPSLVAYSMSDPVVTLINDPNPAMLEDANPITIQRLEEFSWAYMDSIWDEVILRRLCAPKLEKFSWKDFTRRGLCPRNHIIKSFFHRLPVDISHVSISFNGLVSTFPHIPPLHRIKFLTLDCNDTWGSLNSVLFLSPGLIAGTNSPMVAFPELEEFIIGSSAVERWRTYQLNDPAMQLLIYTLHKRPSYGGKTFAVNFRNSRLIWEPQLPVSKVYRRLLAARQLVIKENGVVPQWCQEILGGGEV